MPIIAILGASFFIICGTGIYQLISSGDPSSLASFGVFAVLFILLMFPSIFFYNSKKEETIEA